MNQTERTLKQIESLSVLFLKHGRKIFAKEQHFRNVTGCNNFSKVSPHFKKLANSSRRVLQRYSGICNFCVIQYIDFQNKSVEDALKILGKPLKTVSFIANLYSFSLPTVPQENYSFHQVSHLHPPRQNNFQNSLSSMM